ncbi:MAG: hypothetical protein IIB81_02525, partial [Nanoarchaeota archaeon]|nr:hypothetical protein [Nanoarchaeota archaeon]
LDNLRNSIERNELDLDEKKKKKALVKIHELDGVYFAKIKDDFKNAKQRLNDIEYKIKNNEANKELESNNKELKIINENIESLNGDISTLNNELEKINIKKLKEDLQEEVNDVANTKIIIL